MSKNKNNLMRKICVYFCFLLFFLNPIFSDKKINEFEPIIYIKSQQIKDLYPKIKNSVLNIAEKLPITMKAGIINSIEIFFNTEVDKWKEHINLDSNIFLAFYANKFYVKEFLMTDNIENEFSLYVNKLYKYRLQISLKNKDTFIEFLNQNNYKLEKENIYSINDSIIIEISDNNAFVYNQENLLSIDEVILRLDKIHDISKVKQDATFIINFDFTSLEKVFAEKVYKYLHYYLNKEPDENGEKMHPLLMAYIWEVYSRFQIQNIMTSAEPAYGWVDIVNNENQTAIKGIIKGDLSNRPLHKLFITRRSMSMQEIKKTGQFNLNIDDPVLFFSIPAPLKDYLNTLESYQAEETFLLKDIFNVLILLTDAIFLEDTRKGFWKGINSSLDIYLFSLPEFSQLSNVKEYKFAAAYEVEDAGMYKNFLNKYEKRLKVLETEIQDIKIEKSDEGFYQIIFEGFEFYISLENNLILITNDVETIKKGKTLKKQEGFFRSSKTFNITHAKDYEEFLPFGIMVNFAQIKNMLSKEETLFPVETIVPDFHFLQFEMRENIQGDSSFELRLQFNNN
ncbi:MAG: hypothetical protein OEZ22_14005 [Spirochaetia bacterium]|nr:hypothetical protein [Spirochaetia bacterium]